MSVLSKIKEWFHVTVNRKVTEEFQIDAVGSDQMKNWIQECINIYQGSPCWIDEDDEIDTVNFAKAICSETARLATLAIGINVDGSPRAKWLQEQIDKVYYQLRHWVEYGCAHGTIILKPNGTTIDLYTPGQFEVTHAVDGVIDGVVFYDSKKVGDKWYTRLEYHRYVGNQYNITNKCYVGNHEGDTKKRVDIKQSPWDYLQEEVAIVNVSTPLFAVFRTPQANNIDLDSPYGLPIFSEAIQELRDLDIAYSRNTSEITDSKRTVMVDDSLVMQAGKKVSAAGAQNEAKRIGLPKMAKMVRGDGRETYYQEINPQLNTTSRLEGINALLSQIGYKVGYSNGYFVFNEASGIQTATGVEAEQQRTVQFIKDVRDKLESCITNLIYALNAFADLYNYAPSGAYEVAFDFGDITYNRDEDRTRWWGYVTQGKVPAWRFFVKFEGMTEEEAKAMVEEATPKTPALFPAE